MAEVIKARDTDSQSPNQLFDIGAVDPEGNYALAAFDEATYNKIVELLAELGPKLQEGGTVALSAATLSALETINANIVNPVTVGGTVELGSTTLSALETINASVTGTVSISNALALDTGTLAALESVTATLSDNTVVVDSFPTDYPDSASQGFLDSRYGGGKQAVAVTVNSSGNTTLVTPAQGYKIRVYWVYAVTNPTATAPPVITFKFGNDEFYKAYAVSHWEIFDGPIGVPLRINLSNSETVAVTVHYEEVIGI